KDALRYVRHHPGSVPRTAYFTFLRLFSLSGPGFERYVARFEAYPPWLAVASMYAFWAALGLAIAGAFTVEARRAPAALWWIPAVIVLTCLFFEGSTRYRAPADPYILVLSALGLIALAERVRGRPRAAEAR